MADLPGNILADGTIRAPFLDSYNLIVRGYYHN